MSPEQSNKTNHNLQPHPQPYPQLHPQPQSLTQPQPQPTQLSFTLPQDPDLSQPQQLQQQYIRSSDRIRLGDGRTQRAGNLLRFFMGVFVVVLVVVWGGWWLGVGWGGWGSGGQGGMGENVTVLVLDVGGDQGRLLRSMQDFINLANKSSLIPPSPNHPQTPQIHISQILLLTNKTYKTQTIASLTQPTTPLSPTPTPKILYKNSHLTFQYLDSILSSIDTQYYYLATSDWIIVGSQEDRKGQGKGQGEGEGIENSWRQLEKYLEYCLKFMKGNIKIGQILGKQVVAGQGGVMKGQNRYSRKLEIGFSFKPSLHRISDYVRLRKDDRNGFTAIGGEECQVGDSRCQRMLSQYFIELKKEVYETGMFNILKLHSTQPQNPQNSQNSQNSQKISKQQSTQNKLKPPNTTQNPAIKLQDNFYNKNQPIIFDFNANPNANNNGGSGDNGDSGDNGNGMSVDGKITQEKILLIKEMVRNSGRSDKIREKEMEMEKVKNTEKVVEANTNITPPVNPTPIPTPNIQPNLPSNPKTAPQFHDPTYLKSLIQSLQQPPQTILTQSYTPSQPYPQLPFCIFLPSNTNLAEIKASLSKQNYKKYTIIDLHSLFPSSTSTPFSTLIQTQTQLSTYFYPHQQLHKIYKQKCDKNSIIFFVNSEIKEKSLEYLNWFHQKYRTYFTYAREDGREEGMGQGEGMGEKVEIYSVLGRVFQLLWENDFQRGNRKGLEIGDSRVISIGILQLAQKYARTVQKSKITSPNTLSYLSISISSSQPTPKTAQYQPLLKLSQDHPIPPTLYPKSTSIPPITPFHNSFLNLTHILPSIQRQQLPYLPSSHLIQLNQYEYFNTKYNISYYSSSPQTQQNFCITVMSHNNIQNNRYKKLINSITQQNYTKFHVVFIDDFSGDGNLEGSWEYFRDSGFGGKEDGKGEGKGKGKVVFVKNKRRNFATYNFVNAAFNYCGEDQIQVLVDGDDQLIGKYALQVMNSMYRSDPGLWIVYSNYKTSQYNYGLSRQFYSDEDHASNNKRKSISFIGPIRTWKVKLLTHIPLTYHKMKDGNWLDTVSDDAIQHPLLELASVKRVKYVIEILYEYNVKYGDNDDSTKEKIQHRKKVYWELLKLRPLGPLGSLDQARRNLEVEMVLRKDRGVRYETYVRQL